VHVVCPALGGRRDANRLFMTTIWGRYDWGDRA
jgi:hypothetical protein